MLSCSCSDAQPQLQRCSAAAVTAVMFSHSRSDVLLQQCSAAAAAMFSCSDAQLQLQLQRCSAAAAAMLSHSDVQPQPQPQRCSAAAATMLSCSHSDAQPQPQQYSAACRHDARCAEKREMIQLQCGHGQKIEGSVLLSEPEVLVDFSSSVSLHFLLGHTESIIVVYDLCKTAGMVV